MHHDNYLPRSFATLPVPSGYLAHFLKLFTPVGYSDLIPPDSWRCTPHLSSMTSFRPGYFTQVEQYFHLQVRPCKLAESSAIVFKLISINLSGKCSTAQTTLQAITWNSKFVFFINNYIFSLRFKWVSCRTKILHLFYWSFERGSNPYLAHQGWDSDSIALVCLTLVCYMPSIAFECHLSLAYAGFPQR